MSTSRPRTNPYPGPRSFQRGEKLYGRQRETAELLDLLIAERVVLLYSPSGAGKTSLVQAALAPELEEEGFRVLPAMRPGLSSDGAPSGANRYVLSLLLGLERGRPEADQRPLPELAGLTLAAYLDAHWPPREDDTPWHGDVLIFDQFEEVITVDAADRAAKVAFFEQLGEVLRDRGRWALFSMREEFVAALDPYLRPIPTRFDKGRRYRLDLLGPEAAREAMQGPAADHDPSVVFTNAAARKLADDLRRVKVQQPDGRTVAAVGQYIEPVQLQVVCRRLWDNLAEDDRAIDVDDLAAVGDVDTALAGYYVETVSRVAGESGVRERAIREWIDRQLITEGAIRGQVLMGVDSSNGLVNTAIWPLVDAHLVRAEQRRGATWFELAHDRLVEPVRANNAAWFEANLSTLQRQAALWEQQQRPDGLLLRGEALAEAEQWAETHDANLEQHERAFLSECLKAGDQAEREHRQARRIRRLAIAACAIALIAIIAAVFGVTGRSQATRALTQSRIAAENERQARATADANAVEAETQRNLAVEQGRIGRRALARQLANDVLAELDREQPDSDLALLLAQEAVRATWNTLDPEERYVEDAAYQALAEALAAAPPQVMSLPRQRHAGLIWSAAFSPAGDRVVTSSRDGTARVWDAAGGEQLLVLRGHGCASADECDVLDAAFSPDGGRIVTGGQDGTARIWDAASGQELLTLRGHDSYVESVAFDPAGRRIVTAGQDGAAIVWDAATGERLVQLRQPACPTGVCGFASAVFDPAGERVLTGGDDGVVRVWQLPAGVAGGEEGAWQVLEIAAVECPQDSTCTVAAMYSPAGDRIASEGTDGALRVWDAASGSLLTEIAARDCSELPCNFAASAFDPSGEHLAATGFDDRIRVWDAATGEQTQEFGSPWCELTRCIFPALAYSPGGDRIVAGTAGDFGVVWDAGSGREIVSLGGHVSALRSAEYDPRGERIVTAGFDGTARVWEAATGRQMLVLRGDLCAGSASRCALLWAGFSSDGGRIVTTGGDGVVRVWDAASGEALAALRGHECADDVTCTVRTVAFDPAGERMVTAGGDGTARVWDAASGRELLVLPGHGCDADGRCGATSAQFSPAGDRIVTSGSDGAIRVWRAADGEQLAIREDAHGCDAAGNCAVLSASFSPDGSRLVTGGADGVAKVWDASLADVVLTLAGQQCTEQGDCAVRARFDPTGSRIVTAGADGAARVWDAATGELMDTLTGHDGPVMSASYSPGGERIVTAGWDGAARVWDAGATGASVEMAGHDGWVWSAAASPDGRWVATAGLDGTARLWDAQSGRELLALTDHSDQVMSAEFDPAGQRVVTASLDGTARLWQLMTDPAGNLVGATELLAMAGHECDEAGNCGLRAAGFDPTGQRVVTGGADGTARVWQLATGDGAATADEILTISGHGCGALDNCAVHRAAFSPAGDRIVTTGADNTVKVWDAASGQKILTIAGHGCSNNFCTIQSARFSSDGRRLVSAGDDGTARIWDAQTGEQLLSIDVRGCEFAGLCTVNDAALSPDGAVLATGGVDGVARLWDAATGRLLLALPAQTCETGLPCWVNSVRFDPAGSRVIAAGMDNRATIWQVDPDALLALAAGRVLRFNPWLSAQETQRFGLD